VKVVVTGATGNVGTAVLRSLAASGRVDHVTGVVRRVTEGLREAIPWVEWHAADVGVDDLEPLLRRADTLVHLAWQFHPVRRPVETWRTNVLGSIRTFDAAAAAGVRTIVCASSVGTYSPGPHTTGAPDEPVDEEWPTHALPTAAYGRQKSYVERVLDAFEPAHPKVRVVRIRNAFVFQRSAAPEQRRIFLGPFVPSRLVASGRLGVVPLPRGLRFQTVHADDLAAAYVAAVEREVGGPFNIAASPVVGAQELGEVLGARVVDVPVDMIKPALGAAFHLRLAPVEPGLLTLFMSLPLMDTTWARERLGWEPRHGALHALHELLAGLRTPDGGPTPPLQPHAGGPRRIRELASGLGSRQ
jgi:UDP-glucose 4-epimerase